MSIDTSDLVVGQPDPWAGGNFAICAAAFTYEGGDYTCTAPRRHGGQHVATGRKVIVGVSPAMVTVYFTFGVQYARTPHPTLGHVAHPEGWAEVTAPTYAMAVSLFSAVTRGQYAFDYAERPDVGMFPRGCVLRVTMEVPAA